MQQSPVSCGTRSRATPRIGPWLALRNGPVPWGRVRAFALLALAAMAFASGHVAFGEDKPRDPSYDDKITVVRPAHWWLEMYAHTMQEQAFIHWMDAATGSQAWRHTMQEKHVNALWLWWLGAVWNPADGFSDTRR